MKEDLFIEVDEREEKKVDPISEKDFPIVFGEEGWMQTVRGQFWPKEDRFGILKKYLPNPEVGDRAEILVGTHWQGFQWGDVDRIMDLVATGQAKKIHSDHGWPQGSGMALFVPTKKFPIPTTYPLKRWAYLK